MGQTKTYSKFQENPLSSKMDFQTALKDLFDPLLPYFSSGGAEVHLSGAASFDLKSSYLEGFSRPLWGIIPLIYGGGNFEHMDCYLKGLDNGSNPSHLEYWGDPSKEYNQRCVEMAAIGFGLAMIPEKLYDPLSDEAKENLVNWLAKIQYAPIPINNWLFFIILVQEGLMNIGRSDLVDKKIHQQYLDQILQFYRFDGWYSDGLAPNTGIDHYNGFALHFYGLLYAYIHQDSPNDYSEKFKTYADEFAKSFIYWFTSQGDALPIGRSLTYRFAMGSFWGILGAFGHSEFSLAQIKGIWQRHLKYWQDKPIFSLNNTLSRGYLYESDYLCERYNSATSPYWAFKYFAPLMLKDNHAFWQVETAPFPKLKKIYPMAAANMIIRHHGDNLEAETALNIPKHMRFKERYNKFSYSTKYGFNSDAINNWSASDNIILFSKDKEFWVTKNEIFNQKIIGDNIIYHEWTAGKGLKGSSYAYVYPDYTIRRHNIMLDDDYFIIECGYAGAGLLSSNDSCYLLSETPTKKQAKQNSYVQLAGDAGTYSLLADIDGERLALKNNLYPNTNVLYPHTHASMLIKHVAKGGVIINSLITTNEKFKGKEAEIISQAKQKLQEIV